MADSQKLPRHEQGQTEQGHKAPFSCTQTNGTQQHKALSPVLLTLRTPADDPIVPEQLSPLGKVHTLVNIGQKDLLACLDACLGQNHSCPILILIVPLHRMGIGAAAVVHAALQGVEGCALTGCLVGISERL